ncbi:uncharacterized protein AAG666_009146 isoform 1-T1 [Megaptera novaeangliae]
MRGRDVRNGLVSGVSGGRGSSRTPPGRPRADPRPGPLPLAAGPHSAFTARSGSSPPLGRFRFRFRFPAESVEENESGGVQQPAYQPSGRGAQGAGRWAWGWRVGAAARARRDGSRPWTSLHCRQS